jgi:hypothetical protein
MFELSTSINSGLHDHEMTAAYPLDFMLDSC